MNARALDTAFRIGARLARDAVWHEDRCNWFSPVYENFTGQQQLATGTLGPTLYDGTAGIALFLAHLHRQTGDGLFAGTAEAAIEHAIARRIDIPESLQLGFYTGYLGIGYAAAEVGRCLDDAALVKRGLSLIRHTLAIDPAGKIELDVMSGRAGAIPALLRLHAIHGGDDLFDAARAAGELLLDRAVRDDRGLSWDTMGEMARGIDLSSVSEALAEAYGADDRPRLTGLSHGAGGIGWALTELAAATGDTRFGAAAREAFAYEDSSFDGETDRWPDLRHKATGQPPGPPPAAWCHGAVGIGLARLRAFEITGDPAYREAVQNALRITARSVIGQLAAGTGNFSLCHGLAGNAELFLLWHQITGDPEARQLADAVAEAGIDGHDAPGRPWPSGIEGGGEAPSLMLGLAGTGYFYLRIAEPRTPSVVLVTPRDGKPPP